MGLQSKGYTCSTDVGEKKGAFPDRVRDAIIRARVVASTDKTRPLINTVCWLRTETEHVIMATDPYRLLREVIPVYSREDSERIGPPVGSYWLLPLDALNAVLKAAHRKPGYVLGVMLEEDKPPHLMSHAAWGSGRKSAPQSVPLELEDGDYVDYSHVLGEPEWAWRGHVGVERLRDVLKRLRDVAADSPGSKSAFAPVKLIGGRSELRFEASSEGVRAEAVIPACETEGAGEWWCDLDKLAAFPAVLLEQITMGELRLSLPANRMSVCAWQEWQEACYMQMPINFEQHEERHRDDCRPLRERRCPPALQGCAAAIA